MNEKGLRVLTYNIHKGFDAGNRRFILHQIRDALRTADADLMFLQEIQGEHKRHQKKIANWPTLSPLEFLAEATWPFHAYGKNAVYNTGHHGNAILCKYPFKLLENINVSPYPWASRSMMHGVIQSPNNHKEIHIVCIHFGIFGNERRRQISKLSAHIHTHVPHDAPLIVAGDFNDWMGQADRLLLEHLGLQEVFHIMHGRYARSFPSWLPILPMDRIYFRGLIPICCERLTLAPWHTLSDHSPLTASFAL
jgi:endonuclease/exonuclease/phosphatase family metal-dependent hydrolase